MVVQCWYPAYFWDNEAGKWLDSSSGWPRLNLCSGLKLRGVFLMDARDEKSKAVLTDARPDVFLAFFSFSKMSLKEVDDKIRQFLSLLSDGGKYTLILDMPAHRRLEDKIPRSTMPDFSRICLGTQYLH